MQWAWRDRLDSAHGQRPRGGQRHVEGAGAGRTWVRGPAVSVGQRREVRSPPAHYGRSSRCLGGSTSACIPRRSRKLCILTTRTSSITRARWDRVALPLPRPLSGDRALTSCVSAGGRGESRPGEVPQVRRGPVPVLHPVPGRAAVHPGEILALRAGLGPELLRQLLVVIAALPGQPCAARAQDTQAGRGWA